MFPKGHYSFTVHGGEADDDGGFRDWPNGLIVNMSYTEALEVLVRLADQLRYRDMVHMSSRITLHFAGLLEKERRPKPARKRAKRPAATSKE